MGEDSEKRKRRRRRAWDEWQRELARRRERRTDPAGKVMLQLLALLVALAVAFQQAPAASFEFSRFRRRDRRQPPPGYPNGRAAWARERGLEPEPEEAPSTPTPRLRPQPRPLPGCSWSRLVKDLNRRPTRERARAMIEERVPEEAHGWLRATISAEDWQTLRGLGRGADAQTICRRALAAAKVAPVPALEAEPEVDAAPPLPGMK